MTAALVGEYRWIENALYSTLGSWVVDMPIPAVQVHVDAQSMRHAWHAELWAERLPVLAGVDPERLTVPSARPSRPVRSARATSLPAAVPGRAAEERAPPGALPRLAAIYRVILPRLVTTYVRHLRVASPMTDGPVRRPSASSCTTRPRTGTPASGWCSAW